MIWFMVLKKESRDARFLIVVVQACTKSLNKQSMKKKACTRISRLYEHVCTYRTTEGRNFKTFSNENYAIASGSCYLFTKKY